MMLGAKRLPQNAAGDKPHLEQTLELLRKLDKKSADEVEKNIEAAQRERRIKGPSQRP